MKTKMVIIDYTNWRGERATRRVIPRSIVFASNEWHSEMQWLLIALDVEKADERTFALKDIHSWKVVPQP
jgi:predicted DNA-binding transcriptional regulator YafY